MHCLNATSHFSGSRIDHGFLQVSCVAGVHEILEPFDSPHLKLFSFGSRPGCETRPGRLEVCSFHTAHIKAHIKPPRP